MEKKSLSILLVVAMLGWGLSWVNIKVLSSYTGAYEIMVIRYAITAISVVPIIIFMKDKLFVNYRDIFIALFVTIFYVLYSKYFYLGTKLGTASLGGAFVTTLIPIITFLILVTFTSRKLVLKDVFALILGAIGVMSIIGIWSFDKERIFAPENLYFVLAALLWALVTIFSAKRSAVSPLVFTFYLYVFSVIAGGGFLIDVDTIVWSDFDTIFWINMLCISLVATTFSSTVYFLGVEKLGASEVSSFIFLVPFFAIISSIVFLQEELSISIILGTILTVISVMILNNIKIWKRQ